MTQSGGTITVGGLGIGNSGTLNGGSGTGVANISAGTLNADRIYLGSTAGGTGTLTLSPAAQVNVANGLAITVGGTLGGNGTVNGNVASGGVISPGNSPGSLVITGNLELNSTSSMDIQLGGTTQGTTFDFLHVTENLTLAGNLDLSFVNGFNSQANSGETFTIVSADAALVGAFANIASGSRLITEDGSASFVVNYGNGHDVVLSGFQNVPEPAGAGVLALAALGALSRRRRKERHFC